MASLSIDSKLDAYTVTENPATVTTESPVYPASPVFFGKDSKGKAIFAVLGNKQFEMARWTLIGSSTIAVAMTAALAFALIKNRRKF